MVKIDVAYEGDLHTTCRHGPSGRELETDAPVDNQGRGESFSPTDLLATALGTCTLTVMGIVARREGWKLEGARSRVEKHMVADPVRRVGRLVLHFELPAGFAADARATLEEAARTCPVKQSIHPEIETELVFDWA
ncbi:MAG: OsmC family protein [Myxococcota bacterium]|jgi:putative redox protein